MKIYDISQEVFGCVVFGGDPAPQRKILCNMDQGDLFNLTEFSMCAHNGTHIDAPYHFINDGKTIDEIPLEKTVGYAYVAEHNGIVDAAVAHDILGRASEISLDYSKRILIKGKATVSLEAAEVFVAAGVWLVGNESQTVGPEKSPIPVHNLLLGAEVVLLEGVRLGHVPEGAYLLSATPLNLGGAEGSPCRAVLISEN